MKKEICHSKIFWLILVMNGFGYSQVINVGGSIGYSSHTANYDPKSPSRELVVPSVGSFYDDNLLIGFESQFYLSNKPFISPFLQCTYDYEPLKNSTGIPRFVLGDDLSIHNFEFSFGLAKRMSDSTSGPLLLFFSGVVFKKYAGSSISELGMEFISRYTNATAFRIGAGLQAGPFDRTSIYILFKAYFDFGTVKRGTIDAYENDIFHSSYIPEGDIVLPDNVFSIRISMVYRLEL